MLELDLQSTQTGDPPDNASGYYSSARTLLLAYFIVSATSANASDLSNFLAQAPDRLQQIMQNSNPALKARTLDAFLFLTQKGLEAYTDNPLDRLFLDNIVDVRFQMLAVSYDVTDMGRILRASLRISTNFHPDSFEQSFP
jgi:hypothetical protein